MLAERHRSDSREPDPSVTLVNYAESPRAGGWTLRASLVRMAQPEPVLVASVLELVRRLDAVLHHVRTPLAKVTVECDRALTLASAATPTEPYPDTRTAELARLVAEARDDGHAVIDAYMAVTELSAEEQGALGLFSVALEFDQLADELALWAPTAPAPPPVDTVRTTVTRAKSMLDELGVPVEQPGADHFVGVPSPDELHPERQATTARARRYGDHR